MGAQSTPAAKTATRGSRRASLMVGLVALAAGLLLGASINTTRHYGPAGSETLTGLVANRETQLGQLEEQVEQLHQDVEILLDAALPNAKPGGTKPLSRVSVSGPGVVVSLSDSADDFVADQGTNVNDMVVHQQDVDAVVNALWRGGAEAIAVQGVRLASDTPLRCVGNVILVGTRAYAPPYVIEAIGPPEEMTASIESDERVQSFRRDARRYEMGWEFSQASFLVLPAATEVSTPKLAEPSVG